MKIHVQHYMHCYCHCRYDWYQTETDVIIAIMVKNASPDDVQIDFTEKAVHDTSYKGWHINSRCTLISVLDQRDQNK